MSRLVVKQHSPDGYRAAAALDAYLQENIDHEVLDLVRLRASQLNGCAFCVDMHSLSLERAGVPTRKIYAVGAWREASAFTERERAALALTEQVTFIASGVDDDTWRSAAHVFSKRELSDLILAIGTINLWNRIGVSTHMSPPSV
ncbi:MAG TPA: carboxymuconolactone decarboxylase family protein [Candidatus Stackebrandtia excrementipullorum]|nr:carboxymuconolactone decarboxylase family protein [Candidatus Stackebrandtia excrementipullorum]